MNWLEKLCQTPTQSSPGEIDLPMTLTNLANGNGVDINVLKSQLESDPTLRWQACTEITVMLQNAFRGNRALQNLQTLLACGSDEMAQPQQGPMPFGTVFPGMREQQQEDMGIEGGAV